MLNKTAKINPRKNFNRICSFLLSVSLIATLFTGLNVNAINAQSFVSTNALCVSPAVSNYVFFGQQVSLNPNKTYIFSYKYSNGFSNELNIFTNSREDSVPFVKTELDSEAAYFHKAATFTVPENAADGENGTKKIWVGFRVIASLTANAYCCDFKLYDSEAPENNLLPDSNFDDNGENLSDKWTNPYGGSANSGYAYNGFSKKALSSLDTGIFEKTESDRHVIKIAPSASYQWFGQQVALDADKTYVFTYNFTKGNNSYPCIYKNLREIDILCEKFEDEFTYKQVTSFMVPRDALDGENGKKLIWVGIRTAEARASDEYLFDFNLYDVENPNVNLFEDKDWLDSGFDINGDKWITAWNCAVDSTFSETSLGSIGGSSIFKKLETNGNVLEIAPELNYQWFGQQVSLNPNKTYVFSYYHTKNDNSYPNLFKNLKETGFNPIKKEDNANYYKKTVTFQPPADALDGGNGNKLIWVGIRTANPRDGYAYCYRFNLYDIENPDVNLFQDGDFLDSGLEINRNKWIDVYGGAVKNGFTENTLKYIGGTDSFIKDINDNYAIKMEAGASWEWFGQQVALKPDKTYKFSYFYSIEDTGAPVLYKNMSEQYFVPISTEDDEDLLKRTVTFTIPSDALDGENGNKLIWVGIRGSYASLKPVYYYKFNLYDVDNPNTNLFDDQGWLENYSILNREKWCTAWGLDISQCFSKVKLREVGGNNTFLRPYKVSIIYNTVAGNKTYQSEVYSGSLINAPEVPLSDDYILAGWYKDSNYSAAWKFDSDTPSDNMTLFAKWVLKGDINQNNKIDVIDLVKLKKHLAGNKKLTGENLITAMLLDGKKVSSADCIILKKKLLGITPSNATNSISGGADNEAALMQQGILNAADNLSVTGNKYYVSASGSDYNNGKTPNNAFKTVSKALTVAKAGDAVLLQRGSVFRFSRGVTLQSNVKYGAYGTGAKPEIWGSPENYAVSAKWSQKNNNVWQMNYSRSDAGIIVFDHGKLAGDMKYYMRDLSKNGDYFFDDANKILYVYNDNGNPGSAYQDIEIGSRNILFRLKDGAQNVTIDNIAFKYTGTFAIRGSMGCSNITITNCEIGWVGGSLFEDGSNRYGNGIEFTGGCQDITVENCWIHQIYDAGFTFQISIDSDAKYNTFKNISVNNNLFEYCSWAFEWWIASDIHVVENISISSNIMRFSGYGWARDDRHPAHIRGPWETLTIRTTNFTVDNNIFDCVNGTVYAWTLPDKTQPGHTLTGNTYYQRKAETLKNYPIMGLGDANSFMYATNQKELEAAIAKMDQNAHLIKWID